MAAVEMKPESGAKGYAMCMQAYSYPNFGKFIKREENHEFCCTRAGIRKTLEFIEGNVPKPVNLHFQHIQLRHRLITNIVSHSYMGGELDRESLNGDDYFKQLFKIMFHNPDLKEATIAALTRDEKKAFAEYITASPKIKHIGIPFKIDVLKSISEKDYTPPEFDLNGKDELILINATIAADTFQYRARNECSNFGAKTLRELIEKPGVIYFI